MERNGYLESKDELDPTNQVCSSNVFSQVIEPLLQHSYCDNNGERSAEEEMPLLGVINTNNEKQAEHCKREVTFPNRDVVAVQGNKCEAKERYLTDVPVVVGGSTRGEVEYTAVNTNCSNGIIDDDCELVNEERDRLMSINSVRDFLDSTTKATSVERINRHTSFFTDSARPSQSWHNLEHSGIDDHHRDGLYRRTLPPLSPLDHASDRRHLMSPARHLIDTDTQTRDAVMIEGSANTEHQSPNMQCCILVDAHDNILRDSHPISSKDTSNDTLRSPTDAVELPFLERRPLLSTEGEVSSPRVAFIVGADDAMDEQEVIDMNAKNNTKARKSSLSGHARNHHRGHWRTSSPSRCRLGSEVSFDAGLRRVVTEPEEARCLEDVDLVAIASHRFTDSKGLRRRKVSHHRLTTSYPMDMNNDAAKCSSRLQAADTSHKMFVELDELRHVGPDDWVWQEKARWIKFEEEVLEDAQRWGHPHVSSLSFHSLLELRQCLQEGTVILDLDATDLLTIGQSIVDMFPEEYLSAENRERVIKILLLKHMESIVTAVPTSTSQANSTGGGSPVVGQVQLSPLAYSNLISPDDPPTLLSDGPDSHQSHVDANISPILCTDSGVKSNDGQITLMHDNQIPCSPDFSEPQSSAPAVCMIPSVSFAGAPTVSFYKSHGTKQRSASVRNPPFSLSLHQFGDESSGISKVSTAVPRTTVATLPHVSSAENLIRHLSHVEIPSSSTKSVISPRSSVVSHIIKRIPLGSEATNVLVGSVDFLDKPVMAFVRLREATNIANMLEVPLPVRFVILVIGPVSVNLNYYEIGRSIATLMSDQEFHDRAYSSVDRQDLLNAIHEFLDNSIVLPPGELARKTLLPIMETARQRRLTKPIEKKEKILVEEIIDDPLRRTGRLFGGVLRDVKRRYPWYISDITDALNLQCIASFFFVYFACLSPAITFGGLLAEKTDNKMGVSEMLVGTSLCGMVFALFAAQPLIIIGATGPVVVFEEAIYKICIMMDIEFLPFRCWISIWILIIIIIVVMLEGSFLVRYITRFTEEVFTSIISLIFIFEVFKKLYNVFIKNPLMDVYPCPFHIYNTSTDSPSLCIAEQHNSTSDFRQDVAHPNTALMSVILTFATFILAMVLKKFRNSLFLRRNVRRAIGDFGVPISIIVMVLVDSFIDTHTEKLEKQEDLNSTVPLRRGWIIHPMGIEGPQPYWICLAAIIPAMLIFILLFMEVQITSMIVNKKSRQLKKGSGYHFDLLLVGALSTISGFGGLPFLCSATVRSLTHVSSLTVYSSTHAPGEKAVLVEVKEQRMTALAVHIMIGISLVMKPVLSRVPLVVLFGIFLYMGIASMTGIQFLERVRLFFIPVKHHPDICYVKRVRQMKMNLFTLIQLLSLAVLWVVKSTKAAIAFPFVLVLMIPLRLKLLPLIFSSKELRELDHDDEYVSEDEEDVEPDFYTQAHMPL